MNPFKNPQIDVDELPRAEDLEFNGLQASYKKAMLISNTVFWLILLTGLSIPSIVMSDEIPFIFIYILIGVFIVAILFSFISIIYGFKNKSYAIRHHDIHFNSGWLWKSKTVVPFKRIQHSEVSQGPIDRMFKLGKLRVFTAGGSGSDLVIPGLTFDEANRLKTLITSKISQKSTSQLERSYPNFEEE